MRWAGDKRTAKAYYFNSRIYYNNMNRRGELGTVGKNTNNETAVYGCSLMMMSYNMILNYCLLLYIGEQRKRISPEPIS